MAMIPLTRSARVVRWLEEPHPILRTVTLNLVVTVIYLSMCGFAQFFDRLPGMMAAFWPAAGVGLAAVFLMGNRFWPAIFLGELIFSGVMGFPAGKWQSVILAVTPTIALLASAEVLRRSGFRSELRRVRDVILLLVVGAGVAGIVDAAISTLQLQLIGYLKPGAWERWTYQFIASDMLGILIVAPVLFVVSSGLNWQPFLNRWREVLCIFVLLASGSYILNSTLAPVLRPTLYLVVAGVVWAALRFQQQGAVLASGFACTVALTAAVDMFTHGPLASTEPRMVLVQVSAGTLAMTALIVGAIASEHADAEHEVRQREADFRSLAESIPQLVWTVTPNGDPDFFNDQFFFYSGLHPNLAKLSGWESILHPDDVPAVQQWWELVRQQREGEVECRLRRYDGVYRYHLARACASLDKFGHVQRWLGTFTDIHESKLQQEHLRHTEKLAATGKLAASIAHEINNPLAAVANLLFLLRATPNLPETASKYAEMAEGELGRVIHITRQTLMFYREATVPVEVAMTDILDSVIGLYSRKFEMARVEVIRDYKDIARILVFPGEMRQVFSNVLLNALEASPAGSKIRVRVRRGSEYRNSGMRGVRITVADSGSGISKENLRTIFEPFFTTKGEKGTGLGLWVTQELIRKNNGHVRVKSSIREGRKGTTFSIFLPETRAQKTGQMARGHSISVQ